MIVAVTQIIYSNISIKLNIINWLFKPQKLILLYDFQCNFAHRYADQVVIGNDILVDENNKMVPARVTNISHFKMQGKY